MSTESNPLSTVSERKGRRKEIKSPVNKSRSYSHWGRGAPQAGLLQPSEGPGGREGAVPSTYTSPGPNEPRPPVSVPPTPHHSRYHLYRRVQPYWGAAGHRRQGWPSCHLPAGTRGAVGPGGREGYSAWALTHRVPRAAPHRGAWAGRKGCPGMQRWDPAGLREGIHLVGSEYHILNPLC